MNPVFPKEKLPLKTKFVVEEATPDVTVYVVVVAGVTEIVAVVAPVFQA